MPGYVLVKMDMSEEVYHAIKGINRVSGFLGAHGKPTPLPDAEVARIINQVEEGGDQPRSLIAFEVGEKVNVTDGPFEGFAGSVEEVDDINSKAETDSVNIWQSYPCRVRIYTSSKTKLILNV